MKKNLMALTATLFITGDIIHSNLCSYTQNLNCVPVEEAVTKKVDHLNDWNAFRVKNQFEVFDYQSYDDGLSIQHRAMIEKIEPLSKKKTYLELIEEIEISIQSKPDLTVTNKKCILVFTE